MPFQIYRTTAEHVIGASDAALQRPEGVDEQLVADFLDTTPDYARDALRMAEQLSLVEGPQGDMFKITSPCASYLCTNVIENKAAILRYVLEQYEPYKTFKIRLALTGLVGEASNQTKALYGINAHREIISGTLTDLGTYAQSLISEGAGLYKPSETGPEEYLQILNKVIGDRESTELFIRRRLGEQAADWIDQVQVLNNLITSYQRAAQADDDPRAPIVHAANGFESFLTQLADHYQANIQNAFGINAKAERLSQASHLLDKHKFMIKYLGHVRNAADHGIDQDIGQQWEISPTTTREYINVTLSLITDIVSHINGQYII